MFPTAALLRTSLLPRAAGSAVPAAMAVAIALGVASLVLLLVELTGVLCIRGHELALSVTDEVAPARPDESLDDPAAVLGLEVLQENTLHRLVCGRLRNVYRFKSVRVEPRVEHTGGDSAGRGVEVLHLLGMYVVLFQEYCELHRIGKA